MTDRAAPRRWTTRALAIGAAGALASGLLLGATAATATAGAAASGAVPSPAEAGRARVPATGIPTENLLINGGFETPGYGGRGAASWYLPSQVPGWDTTDCCIEVWGTGSNWAGWPGSQTAYQGRSFVELNANIAGTLFQDMDTVPGDTIVWRLAHRARGAGNVDVMRVLAGPAGGSGGDGLTALVPLSKNGAALGRDPKTGSTDLSDGTAAWGVWSGAYTIPRGQTRTRFAFQAVSAGSGNIGIGNFLDGIEFEGIPADRAPSLEPAEQHVAGTATLAFTPTEAYRTENLDEPITYSIEPDLPAGLSIDPTTGVISGTPRRPMAEERFTVVATTAAIEATAEVWITIDPRPARTIALSPAEQAAAGAVDRRLEPTTEFQAIGFDDEVSYEISPDLPEGLRFNETTGVIRGTPDEALDETEFTVTATDGEDSATAVIRLSVDPRDEPAAPEEPTDVTDPDQVDPDQVDPEAPEPQDPAYPDATDAPEVDDEAGPPASDLVPARQEINAQPGEPIDIRPPYRPYGFRGEVVFKVRPALPPGLTIDRSTGVISGTPTTRFETTTYTVIATNGVEKEKAAVVIRSLERQRPVGGLGLPESLTAGAWTRLVKPARTNAGEQVDVTVTCSRLPGALSRMRPMGDVAAAPCIVREGRRGVRVWVADGRTRVTVVATAPEVDGYYAYRRVHRLVAS